MNLRNDATGIVADVSGHSLDQWKARIGGDMSEMREAFRQALPYGGQLIGDRRDILLKHGNACFAVGIGTYTKQYVVKTVLTAELATVNVSAFAARRTNVRKTRRIQRQRAHESRRRTLRDE